MIRTHSSWGYVHILVIVNMVMYKLVKNIFFFCYVLCSFDPHLTAFHLPLGHGLFVFSRFFFFKSFKGPRGNKQLYAFVLTVIRTNLSSKPFKLTDFQLLFLLSNQQHHSGQNWGKNKTKRPTDICSTEGAWINSWADDLSVFLQLHLCPKKHRQWALECIHREKYWTHTNVS